MRTYPAEVIRKALMPLIDTDKFVRFSVYMENSRPVKIKAKIVMIWCGPQGIVMEFYRVHWNRRKFPKNLHIGVPVKNIRWFTNPFDQQEFEKRCQEYVLKLTEGNKLKEIK